MGNVMVIRARRQVGNTARQQEDKPKLRVAGTVELVLTAMSRLQVPKLRLSTTQNLFRRTLSGNLQAFTLMTVFPAPTLKIVMNLIE